MKRVILLIFLFSVSKLWAQNQTLKALEDDFIRMTTTDAEYWGYQEGKRLIERGERRAADLRSEMQQFSSLSGANDPTAILQEFEYKFQQLEQLEKNFNSDVNRASFQTGQNIGEDINSGNYEGAAYKFLGALDESMEAKEAQRAMEARQLQLINEKNNRMASIAREIIATNEAAAAKWTKNAAYALEKVDEDYFLAYANYHYCFNQSIRKKFSTQNTYWVNNPCPEPVKENVLPNNLKKKHQKYIEAASRKYDFYLNSNIGVFREAAVAMAGSAIAESENKPEYYYLMGKYSGKADLIQAYSNFLIAKSLDETYFQGSKLAEFVEIESLFSGFLMESIQTGSLDPINGVIESGLHKKVRIHGRTPLIASIEADQPDVLQTFLNDFATDANEDQIAKKLNSTLFYAVLKNKPRCAERLIDLGADVDAELNGYNSITLAEKAQALEVLPLVLAYSDRRAYYEDYFRSNASPAYLLLSVNSNIEKGKFKEAIQLTENCSDAVVGRQLTNILLEKSISNRRILEEIGKSGNFKQSLLENETTQLSLENLFTKELQKGPSGNSDVFVQTGLVSVSPNLMLSSSKANSIAGGRESLVHVALRTDNLKLFTILDQQYDISKANKGEGLRDLLFTKFIESNHVEYLSKDYNWAMPMPNGTFLIHEMARKGDDESLREFLSGNSKIKLDINSREKSSSGTALHIVAERFINDSRSNSFTYPDLVKYERMLRLLIEFGADIKISDANGNTAFDIIKSSKPINWKSGIVSTPEKDWKGFLKP